MILNRDLLASLGRFDDATLNAVLATGRAVKVTDDNQLEELEIDPGKLRAAFRLSFNEWDAKDTAVRAQEEAERKAAEEKRIREEADKRVYEYIATGLLDDAYNMNLLRDFMVQNGMGYSASAVSLAVNTLEGQLHWAIWSKRNQAPEEPPQAEEVLGRVRGTNEKQLPLNATEKDLRNASPTQLRDWMSRKRAATGTEYSAGIGSQQSHGVSF